MKPIRQHLTYANVAASLALFLALGGVGYAATQLPKDSVGAKQLKAGAVTGPKIKDGAVTGAKVRNGSLSSADLAPGTVTSGAAGPVGPAGPAGESGPRGEPGAGLSPATFIDAGLADGEPGCGAHKGFVNWEPAVVEHVGYYRSPDGFVHLKGTGLQCNPDSGVVFVLPPGYRPAASTFFFGQITTTREPTIVNVYSNGEVFSGLPNVELPVALDGIEFRCGPAGVDGCP